MLAAVLVLFVPLSAGAASSPESFPGLQCGIDLVHPGESQQQVLQQCGPPDVEFSQHDYGEHGEINANLEKWIYNFGPEACVYDFMFRDGRLEDIKRTCTGF